MSSNSVHSLQDILAASLSNAARNPYVDISEKTRKVSKTQWNNLPTFDELPKFHEFTGCAWGVWGEKDELGTINLLTEDVVKQAGQEIRLDLELELSLSSSIESGYRTALAAAFH